MFRKCLSIMLVLALLLSVSSCFSLYAEALEADVSEEGASVEIAAGGYTAHSQSEAVQWALDRANDGVTIGSGECVAFVQAYYEYLGVSAVRGNGYDYKDNELPSGWTRIWNYDGFVPQPGDICVWDKYAYLNSGGQTGAWGHVGVVISGNASTFNTVEQNAGGRYPSYKSGGYARFTSYATCFIRPDFTSSVPDSTTVLSGVYVIHSAWDDNIVLDIAGDSKENDANIQLYQRVTTNDVQNFRVIRYGDYYCIKSVYSDLWLDVKLPIGDNSNVKLYYDNSNEENDWQFIDAGDGYFYIRNRTGYYLDVQGDNAVNHANVQLYHFIGNNSQKWRLEDVTKYVNAGGVCKIRSAYNDNMCIDIAGNSKEDRANIQLYENTSDDVQKFRIYKEGNFSCFKSVYSGKWLDIGLPIQNKANVQLWWNNDSDEDKWIFEDAGNGYVYIQSKTGFYLDLEYDNPVNHGNIQVYRFTGNNSQRWRLDDLTKRVTPEEGIYTIHSAWNDNMCLDIQGNSTENRANVILYQYENTNMQKYRVIKSGNCYCLKSIHADKWLDIKTPFNNNSNVQLWQSNYADEEKWIFEDAGNGYVYVRSKLGYYLDLQGDNPVNWANIQIYNYLGTNSQKWKLKRVLEPNMVTVENVELNSDSATVNPSVTVKIGNKTLTNNTDYSVTTTVDNSKTKATVTVMGKGNYSGSVTKEISITKPIQESWITINRWIVINDERHEPDVTVRQPGKTGGYIELVKGKDYTVTVPENTAAFVGKSLWLEYPALTDELGKNYLATITGIGAYSGSIDVYERKNLNSDMIVVHSWTQSDKCYLPNFDLFDGNKKLIKDVDYSSEPITQTMYVAGGTSPVKYAVRIIGKGNYYGKLYIDCEKVEQPNPVPGNISGSITSYLDNSEEITVSIFEKIILEIGRIKTVYYDPSSPKYTAVVKGNHTEYLIENVAPGSYFITVSKKNHISYSSEITVNGDIVQNIMLSIDPSTTIVGDANGDGEVDSVDATVIQRAVTLIAVPYDEETLMNADIDGDGSLTIVDATFIQRYDSKIAVPYPVGEAK